MATVQYYGEPLMATVQYYSEPPNRWRKNG